MKKVNLNDILPKDLPLDTVYTLIRIKSDVLKDDELDQTDEDTVSRELIDYIESFGNHKRELEDSLRELAIANKLPAKVILYFMEQDYFSPLLYSKAANILINTSDKDLIKGLLEKNSSDGYFADEMGRTTNSVRLQVKIGDYDKAISEFDKLDLYYGPNSLDVLNAGQSFEMAPLNDEVFLLLNDIKNSEFSNEEKKEFVKHVVLADSVKMISVKSLPIVEEVFGEEEFDKFVDFLIVAIGQEEKGVFDYDGGDIIDGHNIYNIKISSVSDYRNNSTRNSK